MVFYRLVIPMDPMRIFKIRGFETEFLLDGLFLITSFIFFEARDGGAESKLEP